MKLIFLFSACLFFGVFLYSQEFSKIYEKDVEFMGVNFSKAKFIGSSHFTSGKLIRDDYMSFWNSNITNHYHKNNINNALDLDYMTNRSSICQKSYEKIDPYSLITDDTYRLRTDQVQECIDELEYDKVDKIGVCFVVESFDATAKIINIWFTLVDMNKNQIIFQKKLSAVARKGNGKMMWASGISNFINKTLKANVKSWK